MDEAACGCPARSERARLTGGKRQKDDPGLCRAVLGGEDEGAVIIHASSKGAAYVVHTIANRFALIGIATRCEGLCRTAALTRTKDCVYLGRAAMLPERSCLQRPSSGRRSLFYPSCAAIHPLGYTPPSTPMLCDWIARLPRQGRHPVAFTSGHRGAIADHDLERTTRSRRTLCVTPSRARCTSSRPPPGA